MFIKFSETMINVNYIVNISLGKSSGIDFPFQIHMQLPVGNGFFHEYFKEEEEMLKRYDDLVEQLQHA